MAWTYFQKTGVLSDANGEIIAKGYSGHGDGVNNPEAQQIKCVGPIPQGKYTITSEFNSESHGPYVLQLEPDAENNMFGRSGFLIHADQRLHPGEHLASMGCIVLDSWVRVMIWKSDDHDLEVVP